MEWINGNVAGVALTGRLHMGKGPPAQGESGNGDVLCLTDAPRLDNRAALVAQLAGRIDEPVDAFDNRELLCAAYRYWGDRLCDHLEGAYALAIWDARRRQLMLLRDRLGDRALYWAQVGNAILFASEPVQILASDLVSGEYNLPRLLGYLLGAAPQPTWSFFQAVQRLPEGHRLLAGPAGVRVERYWSWESESPGGVSADEAGEQLHAALHLAVARRLSQTGHNGIILSGGLDSSSVAGVAATQLQHDRRSLHAFTWASAAGDSIDERPLSSLLIRSRPNIVEHSIQADDCWLLSRYPEAYADSNTPETNAYPDLFLATLERARHEQVSVLMSGIGGDPVVGWLVPELALLRQGDWGALWRRWRASGIRRSQFVQRLAGSKRPLPRWLTPYGRKMASYYGYDRAHTLPWRAAATPQGFRRHALGDFANVASLERAERWSRRMGVRLAAPWHDLDLGRLALAMPDAGLARTPPMKRLLRQVMRSDLPTEIIDAPKLMQTQSRLETRGLLELGTVTVANLLSDGRLEELGLIDTQAILADNEQGWHEIQAWPGLWRMVTMASWLSRGRSTKP